mmetsp:Transcript_18660/g.65935  ORF Transcript_18660/g.65935 Transcript_18660/m.65935 type:complete len:406 (+) Transcript_18660:4490-5707(+)
MPASMVAMLFTYTFSTSSGRSYTAVGMAGPIPKLARSATTTGLPVRTSETLAGANRAPVSESNLLYDRSRDDHLRMVRLPVAESSRTPMLLCDRSTTRNSFSGASAATTLSPSSLLAKAKRCSSDSFSMSAGSSWRALPDRSSSTSAVCCSSSGCKEVNPKFRHESTSAAGEPASSNECKCGSAVTAGVTSRNAVHPVASIISRDGNNVTRSSMAAMSEPARPSRVTPSNAQDKSASRPSLKKRLSSAATPTQTGPTSLAHLASVSPIRSTVVMNSASAAAHAAEAMKPTARRRRLLRGVADAVSCKSLASASIMVPNPRRRERCRVSLDVWKPRDRSDWTQSRCAWSKTMKSAISRSVIAPRTSGTARATACKNGTDSYCMVALFHTTQNRSRQRSKAVRHSLP